MGLDNCGKRDWRSISRFYVKTMPKPQTKLQAMLKSTSTGRKTKIRGSNAARATTTSNRWTPPMSHSCLATGIPPNRQNLQRFLTWFPTIPSPLHLLQSTIPTSKHIMPAKFPRCSLWSGGPDLLPQTTTFPLDHPTLMPVMDPLFDTTYPFLYMFSPSTTPF